MGVVISTYIKSTQTLLVDRVEEVVGMDQNSSREEVMTFKMASEMLLGGD